VAYDSEVAIGSGGMGEVFKAWDTQLDRWVALKYLKHDDPELVQRLLREARAQARVDHPGVCKVYEVGESDGRSFIAMQYVDGKLLDEAAQELSLEQKILVVKKVAEAVQAAHTEGLIHRDLKPSNIIVAEEPDGGLRPYVLDFGIAREQEVAGPTMTGQILGTPGYLSPEQARGEVSALDRRTDVFSLGVILYELLAGVRPFTGDSNIAVLINLLGHDPKPLRKHASTIPRDLEILVATCLEKERDRRYPSARALADDLGRFLAGEPIDARPLSSFARLMRLARRHRLVSALAATSVLLALGLVVATVGGWVKYTRDLERERDVAEQNQREAEEVTEFLVDIFEVANPAEHDGQSITAREVLEQGAVKIQQELADQPLARARLLNAIALAFSRLGLYDQAITHAQNAYDVRLALLGERNLAVAESLHTYGEIHRHEGRFEVAESLLRRALEIRLAALGENDPVVATNQYLLADCLCRTGRLDEAEELSRRGLATLQQALSPDSEQVLSAMGIRAGVLWKRGDLAEAEQLFRELLQRLRQTLGPNDSQVPVILNNLAVMLRRQGRYGEAEQCYRQSLPLVERLHGRSHPYSIQVLSNFATVLGDLGRTQEAEAAYRELVRRAQEHYPAGHWKIGLWHMALGRFLMIAGRFPEAEPELRTGVGIYAEGLGAEHPWTAFAQGFLAACLSQLGNAAEVQELSDASLTSLEQLGELNHGHLQEVERLAELFEQFGQHELAERYQLLAKQREG